jgi:hypothetical protein
LKWFFAPSPKSFLWKSREDRNGWNTNSK